MILRFPALDTLELALASGVIPADVHAATVSAAFEPQGAVRVRPSRPLPRAAISGLRRLGVESASTGDVSDEQSFDCWAQLIPLQRESSPALPTATTPVVFELVGADVPALVREILRLGNDRQSLRWLTGDDGERALLRVIGPPYYALLRALDRDGQDDGPVAYVERAPGVLIELGYRHPLAHGLRPAEGQTLLLRAPRRWSYVSDQKFQDLYEHVDFRLPAGPVAWRAAAAPRRLTVPLRLARGAAGEAAELWVLRARADEQLETLVRHADNRLVARLAFAVAHDGERDAVVLRARPSKQAPPALVLEGESYRSYLRLPNLFLPVGTRLHPPLRRDAVARLLAHAPGRVLWLAAAADGGFVPESLPEEAFRPLDQWVDYVLDRDHRPLDAWVQAARFEFEPFVCRDDAEPRTAPRKAEPRPHARPAPETEPAVDAPHRPARFSSRRSRQRTVELVPSVKPAKALERLAELQTRFLALDGPLDDPARRPLWREMATWNGVLDRRADATVCWANALWDEQRLAAEWVDAWWRAEARGEHERTVSAAKLDRLLATSKPSLNELRWLAVALMSAAHDAMDVSEVMVRLDQVQHFWERHEAALPVRAAWLVWNALARLAGDDALMLARARDRALERLHHNGLSRDLDLPGFLQSTAGTSGEQARAVADRLARFQQSARAWLGKGWASGPGTGPLSGLMFAYGLARLGDAGAAGTLLKQSLKSLPKKDFVFSWLARAYEFRIQRALKGAPAGEPLPEALLNELEGPERVARYKVDRLREHSHILEPHERINPYRHWHGSLADEVIKELAVLVDLTDRSALAARMDRLLALPQGPRSAVRDGRVLATALGVAFRLGEAFARGLFDRVLPAVDRLDDLGAQALLLERGLHLAAHFDMSAHVRAYVAHFVALLDEAGADSVARLEPVLGQCFRGLRKLGMRDEMGFLLEHITGLILREGNTAALRGHAARASARRLRLLLHVAAGWFYFGRQEQAAAIVDAARTLLFDGDLPPTEQTALACAYVRALGLASVPLALSRVEDLFQRLDRITDTYTTNSHYSLSQLDLIEAVVLTLASADFVLNEAGRRWLEDDEYYVRRRIHRDVRAALGESHEPTEAVSP